MRLQEEGVGLGLSHRPRPLERSNDETMKMILTMFSYMLSMLLVVSIVGSTLRLFSERLKV